MQGRLRELEEKIGEERSKGQQEKKEQGEQIRSLKAEIKSLTDKIERCARGLHSTLKSGFSYALLPTLPPSFPCLFVCSVFPIYLLSLPPLSFNLPSFHPLFFPLSSFFFPPLPPFRIKKDSTKKDQKMESSLVRHQTEL